MLFAMSQKPRSRLPAIITWSVWVSIPVLSQRLYRQTHCTSLPASEQAFRSNAVAVPCALWLPHPWEDLGAAARARSSMHRDRCRISCARGAFPVVKHSRRGGDPAASFLRPVVGPRGGSR